MERNLQQGNATAGERSCRGSACHFQHCPAKLALGWRSDGMFEAGWSSPGLRA